MIELPQIIVIGDLELLFLGLALGAGAPKAARKILARRYSPDSAEDECDCSDCPDQ